MTRTGSQRHRKNLRNYVSWVAQSVWRLTTGWTVRGLNHGGGEIFRPSRPALGPTQPPLQ